MNTRTLGPVQAPALLLIAVLAKTIGASPCAPAATVDNSTAGNVLARYLREAEIASASGKGAVPFEIDASLPRQKKYGIMRGLKVVAGAGRVAYTQLQFVGDEFIRTAVIARFLKADSQLRPPGEETAITTRVYRFRFSGVCGYNGRTAIVFRTEPKGRRAGLFRGEIWLDLETATPLREWGRLEKSPSVFLSDISFVRDYVVDHAASHPRRIILKMRAAFVGPVELVVWLSEPREPSETPL